MNQRLAAMSRNQKIGTGLIALLVSCGLCSRLGSGNNKPASTVEPTAAVATNEPVKVAATATDGPEATATTEAATATEEATATEVPTEEPTAEPATAVPPTAIPAPVEPTVPPPPPTEAGPPRPDVNPDGDRNCKDFANRQEAQQWWDYWHARGHANPGHLDGGKGNGIVCEKY